MPEIILKTAHKSGKPETNTIETQIRKMIKALPRSGCLKIKKK